MQTHELQDAKYDRLAPSQLHALWLSLPEGLRLRFLGSLTDEAADRLLSYQLRQKEASEQRRLRTAKPPTRGAMAAAAERQPAYPPGDPDTRWSDEELAAFIQHHDRQLAATPTATAKRGEKI